MNKEVTLPKKYLEEYRSLSMWEYFGYMVLFCVPIIGIICILIFSFGGTRCTTNINLRNFAKGCFYFVLIFYVLAIVLYSL